MAPDSKWWTTVEQIIIWYFERCKTAEEDPNNNNMSSEKNAEDENYYDYEEEEKKNSNPRSHICFSPLTTVLSTWVYRTVFFHHCHCLSEHSSYRFGSQSLNLKTTIFYNKQWAT